MNSRPEENQNEQTPREGPLSQGLNAFNKFRGFNNLSGRAATKAAMTIGKFLFTTPPGWVTLGIIAVVGFTLVTLLALGAPPVETGESPLQVADPTATPTLEP